MAHPSATQIKEALVAAMTNGTGVRGRPFIPGTVEPPSIVIVPGTFIPGDTKAAIEFDSTMANGSHDYIFTVALILSDADRRVAQEEVDQYISPEGEKSLKAALEADMTLGGVVSFARMVKVVQYGFLVWNGNNFFGAQCVVEVTT